MQKEITITEISEYLLEKGINAKYTGFDMLVYLIQISLKDYNNKRHIMKGYENVGKEFNQRISAVERNIRNTVRKTGLNNKTFLNLAVMELEKKFGCGFYGKKLVLFN